MSTKAQAFAQLVQEHHPHVVTKQYALEALELTTGKALGGLTGAFGRWSSIDGISLPWVRRERDGEPGWLWVGFDEYGASQANENQPKPSKSPDSFWDGLSDRSKQFLDIVRHHGSITVAKVLEELELSDPRAIGGISGSIRRWGRAAGVEIPYENVRIEGRRGFRWKMPEV